MTGKAPGVSNYPPDQELRRMAHEDRIVSIAGCCRCLIGGGGVDRRRTGSQFREANLEYKTLVFTIGGQNTTLHEDGRQLSGSATPVSRAPELGAQGWELVSVTSVWTTSSTGLTTGVTTGLLIYTYWFKRPK